jgi:hypothetical protein
MKQIKIKRIVEDIEKNLKIGEKSLEDKEKGYPYVAGFYEATLKTVSFMLSQEIK